MVSQDPLDTTRNYKTDNISAEQRPKSADQGFIFNIERFAVHDGPGIRTIVFLKGCPLRCRWCQNPEGQRLRPELAVFPDQCLGCERCLGVCPSEAISVGEGGITTDWKRCTGCLRCCEVCPSGARRSMGRLMSPNEVLTEVLKDRPFYRRSGGGVTLSGGDPVMQIDFSARLLELFHGEGIHTAIETCGFAEWKDLERLLSHTDMVLYDLKHMDSTRHQYGTGAGNGRILANAQRISRLGLDLVIRVPIIPGYNDTEECVLSTARFVREKTNARKIELLAYHTLGVTKYERMGKRYRLPDASPVEEREILPLKRLIEKQGLECTVL
jgi:pyruvate formate lyase activating enzyme